MTTQYHSDFNPEYVDSEVVRTLRELKCLSAEGVYYRLNFLPQVIVFASVKRLLKQGVIGYALLDSELHSPGGENSHSPGGENKDSEHSFSGGENNLLHIEWRPSSGTATGNYLYPYLYHKNRCIIYIGGGNSSSPIAIRRVAEIRDLINRKVLTADLSDAEIRRQVKAVQRRSHNSSSAEQKKQ